MVPIEVEEDDLSESAEDAFHILSKLPDLHEVVDRTTEHEVTHVELYEDETTDHLIVQHDY
jgi:hypothetical protein